MTSRPSELLAAMNELMLGRAQGGFTTCVVLHLEKAGKMTVANAGHLPPYIGGKELATETGLPLGLAAEAKYPEVFLI
jgi:serine phosphatase RsbU (regulator of sigma subunit)